MVTPDYIIFESGAPIPTTSHAYFPREFMYNLYRADPLRPFSDYPVTGPAPAVGRRGKER